MLYVYDALGGRTVCRTASFAPKRLVDILTYTFIVSSVPRAISLRNGVCVYVYDERKAPHKASHCHVSRKGYDTTVLLIPTLARLAGPELPASMIEEIADHIDEIAKKWTELNPPAEERKK